MPDIDFGSRVDWLKTRLHDLEANGTHIMTAIDRDGSPIGFVTVEPSSGWVDQLLVALPYQGSGLGRALMAEARRISPSTLSLDVNAENTRAIAFYQREGFKVTGTGVNQSSGRATLRMVWRP